MQRAASPKVLPRTRDVRQQVVADLGKQKVVARKGQKEGQAQQKRKSTRSRRHPDEPPPKTMRPSSGGITKSDVRRVARRAGVQRTAKAMYNEARESLTEFLDKILNDATVYMNSARRKTVVATDVIHSLRRRGRIVYGK